MRIVEIGTGIISPRHSRNLLRPANKYRYLPREKFPIAGRFNGHNTMKVVIQKVKLASVVVDNKTISQYVFCTVAVKNAD